MEDSHGKSDIKGGSIGGSLEGCEVEAEVKNRLD